MPVREVQELTSPTAGSRYTNGEILTLDGGALLTSKLSVWLATFKY